MNTNNISTLLNELVIAHVELEQRIRQSLGSVSAVDTCISGILKTLKIDVTVKELSLRSKRKFLGRIYRDTVKTRHDLEYAIKDAHMIKCLRTVLREQDEHTMEYEAVLVAA